MACAVFAASCGTTTGDRAISGGLLGAGAGAVIGSATGNAGTGALIGAAAGAARASATPSGRRSWPSRAGARVGARTAAVWPPRGDARWLLLVNAWAPVRAAPGETKAGAAREAPAAAAHGARGSLG
jgi:hypothetical protein